MSTAVIQANPKLDLVLERVIDDRRLGVILGTVKSLGVVFGGCCVICL